MKLVVIFSLGSGAILNVLLGSLHYHDLRLLRGLWDELKKGDILTVDTESEWEQRPAMLRAS